MISPASISALFAILVWDLTMNNGAGFRAAASILAYSIRQIGLA